MKDKICFLSVAVTDERYMIQQQRLMESIQKFHPLAFCLFWNDSLPEGSKTMDESMYGFKVYAVKEALKLGYKKIIWLDTACYLVKKVDEWFELVKEYGVVAAEDDNLLCRYTGNLAYKYFGITPSDSFDQKQHLVGGSVYVFDFDLPLCNKIFTLWAQSEQEGIFGTSGIGAHRHDESCMALALYASGSRPVPYPVAYYNDVNNAIVKKVHFK